MGTTAEQTEAEDHLNSQRNILTQSLDEIANNIGIRLRDVGLNFPVFISVRQDADALATIATPVDPTDEDWQRATIIVCRIMSERIGC